MKITLMRHGKPMLAPSDWIPLVEMRQWIERYDAAEVEPHTPNASLRVASLVAVTVCSTTPRASSSARLLGLTACSADPVFCEAQLPFSDWRAPRLPVSAWAVVFRLMWMMGYASNADPIQTTKARAKVAAQRLVSYAEKGSVLLIGHGIMNRLIAQELAALGWSASSKASGAYWSACTYERHLDQVPTTV